MEQALAQAKRFDGPVIVHAITRKGFGYDAAERARGRPVPRPGPVRHRDAARRSPRAGSGPTSSPTRSSHIGQRRSDVVGDHRRDDAPGRAAPLPGPLPRAHLRRRHRRAARRHLGRRPRDGRPAPGRRGLRDVPQPRLRPGADGRRAAPVRRHLRARPLRRDRRRRRQPQRHVGHVDPPGRAGPAARRAARRRPAARAAQRGRRGRRRPDRACASPRARRPRTSRRSARPAAPTCSSATAPRTSSSSRVGSMATVAVEVADRLVAQGIGVTVVDPRWVHAGRPRAGRARPRAPARRQHRGQRPRRRRAARCCCRRSTTPASTTPFRLHGIPQEFLDHAKRAVILERIGLTPQAIALGIVEDMTALAEGTALVDADRPA